MDRTLSLGRRCDIQGNGCRLTTDYRILADRGFPRLACAAACGSSAQWRFCDIVSVWNAAKTVTNPCICEKKQAENQRWFFVAFCVVIVEPNVALRPCDVAVRWLYGACSRCRLIGKRKIGKPVETRRCPRNGGGAKHGTTATGRVSWEGAMTVRKDSSRARKPALVQRVTS